ncbi:arginase family protein [Nakamurella aerolata]|uniref:Arginase family protein n=1 Tax=Nakamurella aerolata TaxID=1656892 RepID=A0A849A984_9ACTN|nr:arginase family protein [Nakamurella aerolata]
MSVILSPFHLDEQLSGPWPLPPDVTLTPDLPSGSPWERMAVISTGIAGAVADSCRRGDVPVVLSGDCVASLGVVAGVQRAGVNPSVVWLDAHGDVQTEQTSTSGYLGAMPIRQLVGGADRTVPDTTGLRPVPEQAVTLLDGRDLDPPEARYLAQSQIRQQPVGPVAVQGPIVLHVDVDVVESGELPGLLFPASGGPSLDQVVAAIGEIRRNNQLAAISLACTTENRTSAAVLRIATALTEPHEQTPSPHRVSPSAGPAARDERSDPA